METEWSATEAERRSGAQACQEFADDDFEVLDGPREQELKGLHLFFLRPTAHGDGRHEKKEYPGQEANMPACRLVTIKNPGKNRKCGHDQKNRDEM